MNTGLKDCTGREIMDGYVLVSTSIKMGPRAKEDFEPEHFKVSFNKGQYVVTKIGDPEWGKQPLKFFNDTFKVI